MAEPKFADDHKTLEWEERRLKLITLVGEGRTVADVCAELSISPSLYFRLLREAAEQVRDQTIDLVMERFAMHDWRYEALLKQCQDRINACPIDDHIAFAALVRAAISVLERQAKLFGLDRTKNEGGPRQNDWLDTAPPSELVKMAKKMGLAIPEGFTNVPAN